jgi:hypothetical protein
MTAKANGAQRVATIFISLCLMPASPPLVLATTAKRVTKTGAGARYALRNASNKEARSWEPKKTPASRSPSPPLTLASPVNHQRCFRPSHVFDLASFHAVRVPTSSYRSRAFFDSGVGLESGKGGLETPRVMYAANNHRSRDALRSRAWSCGSSGISKPTAVAFDDAARAEVNRRIAKLKQNRLSRVSQNAS